jgi:hypothetical protein
MLGSGGEVCVVTVAVQALLLRELELWERHEIALTNRCNDLVQQNVHGLRVTGLTRDIGKVVTVGEKFRGLPRADIGLHDVTPPAIVGALTEFIEAGQGQARNQQNAED